MIDSTAIHGEDEFGDVVVRNSAREVAHEFFVMQPLKISAPSLVRAASTVLGRVVESAIDAAKLIQQRGSVRRYCRRALVTSPSTIEAAHTIRLLLFLLDVPYRVCYQQG